MKKRKSVNNQSYHQKPESRAGLKKISKLLKSELDRSIKNIKVKGEPRLYYLSYLFRNSIRTRYWGRLGAVCEESSGVFNSVYCDARVGSWNYDQVKDGGLTENTDTNESFDYIRMPAEMSSDAVKFQLWKLTDASYREAAERLYKKKSRGLHFQDLNPGLASNKKTPAQYDFKYTEFSDIDTHYWKQMIRKAGRIIKNYKNVKNSWFEFTSTQQQKLFLDSSGSEVLTQSEIFELRCHLWMMTPEGEGIVREINIINGSLNELPSEKEFIRQVRHNISLLTTRATYPRITSYSGPVLMSAEASGVFFHEVIGHRLEGSRLLSSDEGGTFRDLRNKKVAPEFIDIIDDPTRKSFQDRSMTGHFLYDDEGNPSRPVNLVQNGILKNFLTTSSPIPGQRIINGHARNAYHERPVSRMGNLFIINKKPLTKEELFQDFLFQIKSQNKEFGIYIQEVLGGETGTGSYDFQAFKGEIMSAAMVFADGTISPIRGVDFVGTPLSALDSVIGMGDDPAMFNSYCGAESGVIPVSTICPSMLMSNLELQSKERDLFTGYVLPLPY